MKESILITGANGQIGTVLTEALRDRYGKDRVLATDIREPEADTGPFTRLDVLDREALRRIAGENKVTQIYHLAAILSAKGEQNPLQAWNINMGSLFNVLETARELQSRLFFPSSIAIFGVRSPHENTPQFGLPFPETVYGISKAAGEYWCRYYYVHYGVDTRSLRYPGIIGYESMPGGGTTDYAVEIYHKAVLGQPFECFLDADTRLPMMYMPDAIRATLELMDAPADRLTVRTSYNLAGMSFTPAEVAEEIRKHIHDFQISYKPDFRQKIAETWTKSIDDHLAREEWGWKPRYDLPAMTRDMLEHLRAQYRVAAFSA